MKAATLNFQLPQWVDRAEYPFTSRFAKIDGYNMHYIDEGTGPVMLFVHGTPDWSFLYRDFIKAFSGQYRCIAMDHIGFGLSEKPKGADYRPEAHAARLEKFVTQLNLQDIHLVVHDFGGPIGLSYAVNHPDNIKNIVIFNTWMWGLKGIKQFDQSQMMAGALGKLLYLRFNFSVKTMMKMSYGDKKKLTPHIHNHYIKAQASPDERIATFAFVKWLIHSHDWYNSLWAKRNRMENKPILILWGMADQFFPADMMLKKWTDNFPAARVVKIEGAGHFVQEEAPERSITEMKAFYSAI